MKQKTKKVHDEEAGGEGEGEEEEKGEGEGRREEKVMK